MKVDFSKVLYDVYGKKPQKIITKQAYRLEDGSIEPPTVEDMTLCKLALEALQPQTKDESTPQWKVFGLRVRIAQNNEQDVSVNEAKLIMDAINKYFGPDQVGRAKELLDPAPTEEATPAA